MSYEERFAIVKTNLVSFIKEKITSRYNYSNEYIIWSYMVIIDAYKEKFTEQFSQYMTPSIENTLFVAAKHFSYAVQSFVNTNQLYTLEELLNFVDIFLSIQFNDFENMCDDISMAMYEEEVQSEQDNPSENI